MKLEIKTPSEKLRVIGLSKDINENLGFLSKEHMYMLMKTEVIKSTLEFRFQKIRQFDMNYHLISRLEENFKLKNNLLNPFSRWIYQSIIAELNYRKKLGLISENSFNPNSFEGAKRQEALRFNRYLQYLFPWIDQMDSLDAGQFNKLALEVSWKVLERINDRSKLFKRFASSATSELQTIIINIPQKLLDLRPEDIKKMLRDELTPSLADQSQREKKEASEEIEKVTPLDMSLMSDDVAKELEQKTKP
jgi:hypothetical protein